jgi:ABC-type proline/glycine betaine transport system permease subunit
MTPAPSFDLLSILQRSFPQEQIMNIYDQIAEAVIRRGDLAHLALFVWASGASALLAMTLRDLFAANRRFDEFVRELSLFNRRHSGDPP